MMRAALALSVLCAIGFVDRGCCAWVATPSEARTTTTRSALSQRHSSSTALRQSSSSTASAPSQYTLDGQDIRGEITPLGNIVLVKVKETLTATTGGILLPDQAKERPTEGVVVCAGPGKIHPFTAVRITNPIQAGISVLYGKFDGRPVTYNGEECQVIRDDDVLLMYEGLTMKLDNVVPVRDYVLIEVEKPTVDDLQTTSGVVVAAQVMKDKAVCEGRVAKVGEGRMASLGNLTPSPVQAGDYVKWRDYAGNEVKIEGKEYSLVKMVDLLATRTEAPK